MDRARKAEERSELREAADKRKVSQRAAMRVIEMKARDKAARNIQVQSPRTNTLGYIAVLR